MAEIIQPRKSCSINPLRMSQPLGGAMAFMGLDGAMPLFHGSQGCTAFGLVLLVRHFREPIPFQTTAMNEVTTILGGHDNLEQAILNIHSRAKPAIIGICTTGLVETRGEDMKGDLKLIRARHPELADLALVAVNTPDFEGALQDGWAKVAAALVEQLVAPEPGPRQPDLVNVLAGCHLTPGDVEELRAIVESFGLEAIVLPDIAGSLDGHVPETWKGHTQGGTSLADIARMNRAVATLALGEQMRPAALHLETACGVPFHLFDRLTGLGAVDSLISVLAGISGRPVPAHLRRQRSQLQDAMLDGHFQFGRRRVAVAAEPDLLFALTSFLAEMGAEVAAAVTSTASPVLARVPASRVVVGDLDDLEQAARATGCALVVTHSHGRQMAARLGIPLFRAGFPMFDRVGAAHRVSVGYRGTRDLVFEIANLLLDAAGEGSHAAAQAH